MLQATILRGIKFPTSEHVRLDKRERPYASNLHKLLSFFCFFSSLIYLYVLSVYATVFFSKLQNFFQTETKHSLIYFVCGICGFLKPKGFKQSEVSGILSLMNAKLTHRGPDAPGVWFDSESGIAMGHTRLSVLDLSPAGNQPMVSHSGRYVLSFNGEIYNHLDLRTELEQSSTLSWRGHSDTETLLASIEHWGVKKALVKSEGMFAFALWDANIRTLTLARDRMGKSLSITVGKKTFSSLVQS